jgi:hypothetical protein
MKTLSSLFGALLKVALACTVTFLIGKMLYITFHRADLAVEPVSAFFKTLGFWGICIAVFVANFIYVGLTSIKRGGPMYALLVLDVFVCWFIYGLMF